MRTKTRWLSEEKLVAEIDRQRSRSMELIQAGVEQEKLALARLRTSIGENKDAEALRMQAVKMIRSGELIRDTRLPKLGQKLAELRTETMPFLADQTVPR